MHPILGGPSEVTNTGDRAATGIVQLYGHDLFASVARPVAQLLAYQRLTPGERVRMTLVVRSASFAMTAALGVRVVEPGDVELWDGPSCVARKIEVMLRFGVIEYVLTTADRPPQIDNRTSTTGDRERRARGIQRLSCAVLAIPALAIPAPGNPSFFDTTSLLAPRHSHPDRS